MWIIITHLRFLISIVDFERAFARRFRNHPLYHGKFYECPFSAGTELNFREFLECFIHMASVLPVPSNVNANDIAAKLNYLLTTCSAIRKSKCGVYYLLL
jgi:hypothetical protein